ncbi:ABC transporter substrate-binding protein [Billgrantia saliphila]|uniref:ABC transporter substrate-binding protein n=1 Tax=Billgrantia saliphila TaxID=1848458 RepID=UPI0018CC27FA|nr:ABC transporter substrate-binding protein [Halomonas saliphila]
MHIPSRRFLSRAITGAFAALTLLWLAAAFVVADDSEAEALIVPPQELETRVVVPPRLLTTEALAEREATSIVEVPPMVKGPGFLEKLLAIDPFAAPLPYLEAPAEVPSVVTEPAAPLIPPPMVQLEVMLDWYLNPQHAALLVAREKGMFRRRGLDVRLSVPADPNVPAKLLAAGRTDLAVGRQTQLHLLADKGLPLMRVATLIDTPLAGLMLRADVNAKAEGEALAHELEGLRIGYTDQDGRDILLSGLMAELMSLRDGLALVEAVDVNYAVLGALREEQVDGVLVHQRFLLPRQLADEGITLRVLPVEEHGLPPHDGLILMANRDRLNGKREAVRQLVAALEEAALWSLNHPQEAWELLVSTEPALNDLTIRDAWIDILPRLSLRPAALDHRRYLRFDQYLLEQSVIDNGTPLERLAVDLGAAP